MNAAKFLKISAVISAVLLPFPAPELLANGSYFPSSPWTKEEKYFEKISHKLGFGVLNVLTGWTALLFEPVVLSDNFFLGAGKGILYTVTNTAGGAVHAATFPIPVDVPLPEGGVRFQRSGS